MLHLPIAGQTGSSCGASPIVLQATLVTLQKPGMFAQGTLELHAAFVFAQVPLPEQSLLVEQGTNGFFWQVPTVLGHWASAVQAAALVLQVPSVRHCESLVHDFCDQGWPPAFEQVPGVAEHCALVVQPFPPCAHLPPWTGQVLAAKQPAAAWQIPVPMPVQFAFVVQGVTPSGQTRWLQLPGVHDVASPDGHACLAPVLQ